MERDGAPACAHVERMLPALWVALATTVAPRPLPPHSLRLEYLGASPSDADSPPPPPALPGPCPPSADGSLLGGAVAEWAPSSAEPPVFRPAAPLRLACAQPGATITHVQAFYGTPRGDCRAGFTAGGCNAPTAQAVVDALCLHRSSCSVPTNASVAGWRGPAGKVPSPSAGSGGPKVTLNPASLNGFSPAQTSPGGGGWGSGGQARDLSASFSSAAGSTPAGGNAVPSPLSTGTFEVMTAEPAPLRQAPTLMRRAVLSQVKPAASGEEPSLAIRVTNIPPGMSSAELGALFRGFGAPQTEVTPSSGGLIGRVTFTSDAEMQRALGDPPEAEWPDDDWRDLKLEPAA